MTPERFALLKEVLLTVRRLPAGEREAYVAEVSTGDGDLRAEIDSLLREDSASFAILKSFRLESMAETGPTTPLPRPLPDWVGPYRILGILGEGGMGVVYRAEQLEPIHREVALKLVRPGHDSQRIAARFEAERQTLARMEHPHITRVFDAGTAADGSPYFAMELVRGMPITDYCHEHRLPLRRRLELFQAVCRAVQHAHQKGVIHRDLKPSNLLVETHGEEPIPKVIDFGISKAMEIEVDASTDGMTRDGQLLGTLEYMSPEQARGRLGEIDTRSDVYSLGVVLYELLTGELPYSLSRLSIPEALRAILEEPPKPFRRRATSERLDPDIETIVRKALEKTPDRRYEGAGALTDDLQRFLRSEPITARQASRAYQLRKLVARHRAPFAALVTSTALVLAFGIVMAVMLGGQTRERKRAEREEQKAQKTLQFMHEALISSVPQQGGHEATVRDMLDAARKKLDAEPSAEPEIEVAVRVALASTYASVSHQKDAEEQLRLALRACDRVPGDLRFDRARVLHDLGAAIWYQGAARHAEAESLWSEAIRIRRTRVGDDENDEQLAGLLNNVATSRGNRDPAGAEPLLREAIDMGIRLRGEGFEDHYTWLGNLAFLNEEQGRLAESEANFREALRISAAKGNEHDVGYGSYKLASLLSERGKYDEAESLLVFSIPTLDRVFGHDLHRVLADGRRELGILRNRRGSHASAENLLREALDIYDRIVAQDGTIGSPSSPRISAAIALGEALTMQERFAAADSVLADALRSAHESAEVGMTHPLVVSGLRGVAQLRRTQGRMTEAETLLLEAIALPEPETARPDLGVPTALAFLDLGLLLLDVDRTGEAESALRRCLEELDTCGRAEWWPAAVAKNELACALIMAGGAGEEAEKLWSESRATLVDQPSPVAFGVRQRALEHSVRALSARPDSMNYLDYASALGRM